jgi:beta-lactamase regulating signal transducer with metallopeptidase domain
MIMKTLFLQILDMSTSAAILAVVVMVLRLLLKKAPKAIHCVLWVMVALRLVCPILPESSISLMPNTQPVSSAVQPEPEKAPVTSVQPPAQEPQRPIVQQPAPQEPIPQEPVIQVPAPQPDEQESNMTVTDQPEQKADWIGALSIVWLSGMGAMALYGVGSFLLLRRKVAPAVKEDGVWLCDHVASPFILGIFCPRIYLPSGLEPEYRASVLAHENAHLRRKDHWWKPLGFVLLAIHWFNPVMWLSYILLCRDIEAACDQRVVKGMEPQERKAYSEALLSCAAPRRSIAACPLAFGEQNAKSRIKSVLNYKKPTLWIILVALVASIILAVCFLTDPKDKPADADATTEQPANTTEQQSNTESTPNDNDDVIDVPQEYYELDPFKGIEVYVWEENGELVCGAMSGTNRNKFDEEIQALVGIKLEEMAAILDTYDISNSIVLIYTYGESQYWTKTDIYESIRSRLGVPLWNENHIITDFWIATQEDIKPVFGDGFFYAKAYGYLYRVRCSDMEGLTEGCRVQIRYNYLDKKELSGAVKYEIEAAEVYVVEKPIQSGSLVMDMEIVQSQPSGLAFDGVSFYAQAFDGKLYRVYCNDMTELYQGQLVRVTYASSSLKTREYDYEDPPMGGWLYKYEITATKVEYQPKQADYYTTIYYRWDDPLDAVTPEYYAAPVTKEEWELLWNITQKSRAWQDSVTSSTLLYPTMDFVVLQHGSWWPFSISGDQYIVKGQKFSLLTQTEQELLKNLKSRAYASLQAREYFPNDYLVYQQMPIQ